MKRSILEIKLRINMHPENFRKLRKSKFIFFQHQLRVYKGVHGRFQKVFRSERIPDLVCKGKISDLFSLCTKFFGRPISAQIFSPICCVTLAVFKTRLALASARSELFQDNPCSFALCLDGLMKQGQE